ncbi:MAG: hypothetical protein M1457_11355 [bacterium]|nr:hypothetical protein [bacterium]
MYAGVSRRAAGGSTHEGRTATPGGIDAVLSRITEETIDAITGRDLRLCRRQRAYLAGCAVGGGNAVATGAPD